MAKSVCQEREKKKTLVKKHRESKTPGSSEFTRLYLSHSGFRREKTGCRVSESESEEKSLAFNRRVGGRAPLCVSVFCVASAG